MKMLPFTERKISHKTFLREFKHDVVSEELIWHMDRENRVVEVIKGDNWYLQLDNELPILLEKRKEYKIPKMTYHRLIKGDSDLLIRLYKE